MSTSSGTINSVHINAITLFCAGFTKEEIEAAENPVKGLYFYHTDILDINQSDWRDYTSAFAEDFNNAETAAMNLGVLFSNFFTAQGELLVTNAHPWGAEKISRMPFFQHFTPQEFWSIQPTYREFVEAQQTSVRATPNPQAGGKSHKKRRKSRKKRRKSRKKRRKSRSKKRRTKGRNKRKRKK